MGKQKNLRNDRQKARKKRAESHVSLDDLPDFKRNTNFCNYAELVATSKRSVFLIARFRQDDGEKGHVTTLGTGFLIGNGRLMTCSHVVNNQDPKGESHQDDDLYLFIMRAEDSQLHHSAPIKLKLGETIFDYPDHDAAIIYLPREFYFDNENRMIHHPEDHLVLANDPSNIGTDIGVLGYPMQEITVTEGELNINHVYIRGDKGIVNTRYAGDKQVLYYEFTIAFNPGNSGGPIFNIETGEVIAMVHAYRSVPIKFAKELVPNNIQEELGAQEVVSVVRSTYSLGLASQNYLKLKELHDICFSAQS